MIFDDVKHGEICQARFKLTGTGHTGGELLSVQAMRSSKPNPLVKTSDNFTSWLRIGLVGAGGISAALGVVVIVGGRYIIRASFRYSRSLCPCHAGAGGKGGSADFVDYLTKPINIG